MVIAFCQATSATVLWKPEMNGGSTQTFFVKFWSLSQSSHAKLTPAISDPGSDSDVQYLINNLVPETIYTFQIIARNVYGDSLSKSVSCTTNESRYTCIFLCIQFHPFFCLQYASMLQSFEITSKSY